MIKENFKRLFAGFSFVTLTGSDFDLGHGVTLRSTYAHLFAANMMAFARAREGKHHPAPWHAAHGGFGYDVEVELSVPLDQELPGGLKGEETVWLVAALLRLAEHPYLLVPVTSDMPFDLDAVSKQKPALNPFEIVPRIFKPHSDDSSRLNIKTLKWVKEVWPSTAQLLSKSSALHMALRAADECTLSGKTATALISAWGALEELFSVDRSEIRYRVSANIAAYLEPVGPSRLEMFKNVASLYNARSKAAHSAQDADVSNLIGSFVVLRNALIKIIEAQAVPTKDELENLLFCGAIPEK